MTNLEKSDRVTTCGSCGFTAFHTVTAELTEVRCLPKGNIYLYLTVKQRCRLCGQWKLCYVVDEVKPSSLITMSNPNQESYMNNR